MSTAPLSGSRNGIIWSFGNHDCEYKRIIAEKQLYVNGVSIPDNRLIFPEQVHGDDIVIADPIISYCGKRSSPLYIPSCDALITNVRQSYLAVVTADCIPVLIYDAKKKVVAAVHSGRTGTEKNITGQTIALMISAYETNHDDLTVILGPAVSAKNYPVSEEIFNYFVAATGIAQEFPSLDLKKVVKEQLLQCGVSKIEDIDICTYDNRQFFSYRRNKTVQRQVSLIGVNF